MIFQHVNKGTKILGIATSHIVYLWNKCNHVFVLLIPMPRFISINFYQNKNEIKLFLLKNIFFRVLEVPTFLFRNRPPSLQISGYAPGYPRLYR